MATRIFLCEEVSAKAARPSQDGAAPTPNIARLEPLRNALLENILESFYFLWNSGLPITKPATFAGSLLSLEMAACVSGVELVNRIALAMDCGSLSFSKRAVSTLSPGALFCASARAKFMRASSAALFIHSAFALEYPVGSTLR